MLAFKFFEKFVVDEINLCIDWFSEQSFNHLLKSDCATFNIIGP